MGLLTAADAVLSAPRAQPLVRAVGDRLFAAPRPVRVVEGPLVPASRHRVSVVMPSHGYAAFVRAAIASAATQEGVDVEVVVVDDHGPDDSLAIARDEAARHPEGVVRVIANERTLGQAAAFDVGYRAARGDFLVRLDADDLLVPGALARAVAVMERAPSVGLVYGAPLNFADGSLPDDWDAPPAGKVGARVYRGREWAERFVDQGRGVIATPEAMLRMSALRDVGPWSLALPHTQDLEIWLRVAMLHDVARVDGVHQAAKRDSPGNLTNTRGNVGMMPWRGHADAIDVLVATLGDRLPDPEGLRRRGHRALADLAAEQVVRARVEGRADPDLEPLLVAFAHEHGARPAALARVDAALRLGERARRDPRLVLHAKAAALRETAQWRHWGATGL